MKQRQALSANFSQIGRMTLNNGEEQLRYDPFTKQDIKTEGKIGQNYFGEINTPQPEQIDALSKLKKKLKHQDLVQKGYTINEKPKDHRIGREVALEAPLYDLFDLPNPHYRKQFFPQDLHPIIGYNYNDPDFENNEDQFLDEEDKLLIQGQLDKQENHLNKKKFLLSRVNKTLNHLQDQQNQQRKKEMDQAVLRVILGKNSDNKQNKQQRSLNQKTKQENDGQSILKKTQNSNSPRKVRFDLEEQEQKTIKKAKKISVDQKSKKQTKTNNNLNNNLLNIDLISKRLKG